MKIKFAKRSASQYQESLSSQGSCHESIIAHIQSSSSICGYSSSGSCIGMDNICITPPKNLENSDKSLSLKKVTSLKVNNWKVEKENQSTQNNFWHYESQDSKIRKIQANCSQLQRINLNYKQHAKVLRFEDEIEKYRNQNQKENEFMRMNVQQSSSDGENERISKIREKSKRKIGLILYEKIVKDQRQSNLLSQILQEESHLYI